MTLGRFGLHWARMVFMLTLAICPVRLIEYQSAERLKPSKKVGVKTMPPEVVRAISGTRAGLPVVVVIMDTVAWVLGSTTVAPLLAPGLNNSASMGARMSTDQVVRSLKSSV